MLGDLEGSKPFDTQQKQKKAESQQTQPPLQHKLEFLTPNRPMPILVLALRRGALAVPQSIASRPFHG